MEAQGQGQGQGSHQNVGSGGGVQARGGLIHQQQRGLGHQLGANVHTLALAAAAHTDRELKRAGVGRRRARIQGARLRPAGAGPSLCLRPLLYRRAPSLPATHPPPPVASPLPLPQAPT